MLRYASPLYSIVRIYRETTEKSRDFARFFAPSRSFSPWVRRRDLPQQYRSPPCPTQFERRKTNIAQQKRSRLFRYAKSRKALTAGSGRRFGRCVQACLGRSSPSRASPKHTLSLGRPTRGLNPISRGAELLLYKRRPRRATNDEISTIPTIGHQSS